MTKKKIIPIAIGWTLLGLFGINPARLGAHEMSPSEKPRGVQSFDVYEDRGRIHLLTLDSDTSDNPSLNCHLVSPQGDIGPGVRVASNILVPDYGDHPGDDVQLAVSGEHVVALWQVKGTGWMGCGPIVCAISSDGGRHWKSGHSPADDGTTGAHGFLDVTADDAGAFHAVWLDDRAGHQSLYYARSTDFGASWSKNVLLRDKPCECCWNKIASDGNKNLYVLFRDQNPRDMAMAVSTDGGATWNVRRSVGGFHWDFNGCPHVGGGVAAIRNKATDEAHALVWTGKDDSVGLYHLVSKAANRWSRPQKLGDASARHNDLAVSGDGRLAAVWDAYEGNVSIVEATVSHDDGATWSPPSRLSQAGGKPTHPRVVRSGTEFEVLWIENKEGEPSRLVVERLESTAFTSSSRGRNER